MESIVDLHLETSIDLSIQIEQNYFLQTQYIAIRGIVDIQDIQNKNMNIQGHENRL